MANKKEQKEKTTYEPEVLDNELEKRLMKYEATDYSSLIKQIDTEYQLAWWYIKPKMDEWAVRLKLYNNQKRDKEAIGDPLLFSIHQTLLASLYDDELMTVFEPNEKGDIEVAENLNRLYRYDYGLMQKDILDYEWDWDASFFGRGLCMFMEFDRKMKCPIPQIIDPMTFLRDPRAKSVAGDIKGRNSMRFGGFEKRMTKNEMKQAGVYFNTNNIGKSDNDIRSLIDNNRQLRADAQGLSNHQNLQDLSGENAEYRIMTWFTYWRGKPVMVEIADNRKRIVRYLELPKYTFPIIDRSMYPIAHDWDGVSVPDIIEDKQRARAVAMNLSLKSIKFNLHPRYVYDTNKIKNKADLNAVSNRHVGVDGSVDNAIAPVPSTPIKQEVSWIMELLDTAAQKATATPDQQQGASGQTKRLATEINMIANKVDVRYSLSAKIFGWSEKRFANQWYFLYKDNFAKDIDEKVMRISGALGARWRALTRENIIAKIDPDITVESKVVSDYKRSQKVQAYTNFFGLAMTQPYTNKILAMRAMGRILGIDSDEIDVIIPPTIDELHAEEENKIMEEGKKVFVSITDDHNIHMEIHNRASDTAAKTGHIEAHKQALIKLKVNPELAPQNQQMIGSENKGQEDMMAKMMNPSSAPAGSVAGSTM
ncbi:MAG: hypothetical protein WC900_08685 [Oscillospiraceae bacterium]